MENETLVYISAGVALISGAVFVISSHNLIKKVRTIYKEYYELGYEEWSRRQNEDDEGKLEKTITAD
jgi:hypothetical protein